MDITAETKWEDMSYKEKQLQLYLKQKALLNQFLKIGAISQTQYNKSFGDLTEKMGMQEFAKKSTE